MTRSQDQEFLTSLSTGGCGGAQAWPRGVPHVRGQGQRPRVPSCDSAGTAERSYPTSKVRGGGRGPGEAIPCPRPGVAARRSYPTPKDQWLRGCRRAQRSYSTFKVRKGSGEKIPLAQGKEQCLCFAGAAVKIPHVQGKRNACRMVDVARGHQKADTLKP